MHKLKVIKISLKNQKFDVKFICYSARFTAKFKLSINYTEDDDQKNLYKETRLGFKPCNIGLIKS